MLVLTIRCSCKLSVHTQAANGVEKESKSVLMLQCMLILIKPSGLQITARFSQM